MFSSGKFLNCLYTLIFVKCLRLLIVFRDKRLLQKKFIEIQGKKMVYKEKFNIEGESFFFMPFGVNLIPPTPLLLWSVVPVFLGLVPLFILLSFFPFLICFGCD